MVTPTNQTNTANTTVSQASALKSARVAVLVADGIDDLQLEKSVSALRAAGARVELVGLTPEHVTEGVQALNGIVRGPIVRAERIANDVEPMDYHAVVVPGGALAADALRDSRAVLALLSMLDEAARPMLVVGHGVWLLSDSGVARGRTLTSALSIRKDLERGGAVWKELGMSQENHLVTAQSTEHVDAALAAFIEELGKQIQSAGLRVDLTSAAAIAESPAYAR